MVAMQILRRDQSGPTTAHEDEPLDDACVYIRRTQHVEHARQRLGQWRGHGACASLDQAEVPLRHTEASRELGLRPLTGGPDAL